MRAALLLFVSFLLLGTGSALADDWIALWLHDGMFLGLTENGGLFRHDPGIGTTQFVGPLGAGPWISFGKDGEQLLALKPNGELWSIHAEDGDVALRLALPSSMEWCALHQHPDVLPSIAISCDGEIWSVHEPIRMLADFGPCGAGRWISIATADDSFLATLESGETRQGTWEWCDSAGSFGPGPWISFTRSYEPYGGDLLAMKANGEIWTHGWSWSSPELYLALPSDRSWCGFLSGPVWGAGPGYALTCSGEIWSVASPPEMVGAFEPPTAVDTGTLGEIKAGWR